MQQVRQSIRHAAPETSETISYGMPTFKIGDRAIVWYAGWKSHCSIYPLTDSFLRSHADALKGFDDVRTEIRVPQIANAVPHLHVSWDIQRRRLSPT